MTCADEEYIEVIVPMTARGEKGRLWSQNKHIKHVGTPKAPAYWLLGSLAKWYHHSMAGAYSCVCKWVLPNQLLPPGGHSSHGSWLDQHYGSGVRALMRCQKITGTVCFPQSWDSHPLKTGGCDMHINTWIRYSPHESVLLVWWMREGPSGSWLPHPMHAAKVVGWAEEGASRHQSACGLSVWTGRRQLCQRSYG